jgi:hypothetical protein
MNNHQVNNHQVMQEADWIGSHNPVSMLEYVHDRVSDRKLRLFACACCRMIWDLMTDQRCRLAVEMAEEYVDGKVSKEDLLATAKAAYLGDLNQPSNAASTCASPRLSGSTAAWLVSQIAAMAAAQASASEDFSDKWTDAHNSLAAPILAAEANILRDIVGNPFGRTRFDPQWITPSVLSLAKTVYDERDFSRMAELGETLQQSGCGDAEVLVHCSSNLEHARGCWVVDGLLGKT